MKVTSTEISQVNVKDETVKMVCPCWQGFWSPETSEHGPIYRLRCCYCNRKFQEAFFTLDHNRTVIIGKHWEEEREPR